MNYYIMPKAWDKIINYAKAAYDEYKTEIGGMALIYKSKKGDWIVDRPCIIKQEVSSTNTALDKNELAKYYTKEHMFMEKNHKDVEYRFLWWHSHHTMGAFWSGTDLSTIEEYSDGDVGFALVVNLKEEYKFRVSVWNPVELAEDIDLHKFGEETSGIPKEISKEVKDCCERETQITTWNNNNLRYMTNAAQTNMWTQELEDTRIDRKMDEISNLASYDPLLDKALEAVDDISDSYIAGEIKYPTFRKKLKAINDKCNDYSLAWKINIPSKNEAYDKIMYGAGAIELIEMKEVL